MDDILYVICKKAPKFRLKPLKSAKKTKFGAGLQIFGMEFSYGAMGLRGINR
jgi:hypothetical protein